jgi:hypothetical protein
MRGPVFSTVMGRARVLDAAGRVAAEMTASEGRMYKIGLKQSMYLVSIAGAQGTRSDRIVVAY